MTDKKAESPDIGQVYRSLNNSRMRKDVYEYLCSIYPESASIDDIARATGHDNAEVIGALVGYRLRYRKRDSLVGMGLASCAVTTVDDRPVQMYSATQQGLYLRDCLKDYAFRSHTDKGPGLLRKLRKKLLKR